MPESPSPENVATPEALVRALVEPINDAPAWFTVADTESPDCGIGLDCASRTAMTGCVVKAAPLLAPAGCVSITICDGGPAASAIVAEVAPVSPVAAKPIV